MRPWTSDVELNDDIASRLIADRFPELCPLTLRLLGSGWDNYAYLVNESFVFRIPHRKLGAELMDTECVVLEYLGRQGLPLTIPEPRFVARPDQSFPYTIAGYPIISGVTADSIDWTPEERGKNAGPLGAFLSSLHRVPTDVPFALGDKINRADLTYRLPNVLSRIKDPAPGFCELLTELAQTPTHSGPPVWVHGDLYARHLVADSARQIRGVIDWGDVHVGDPALDIAIAWMYLPSNSWPDFKSAYGAINENTWRRARFRAMTYVVYLRPFAEERNDQGLHRELDFALANTI